MSSPSMSSRSDAMHGRHIFRRRWYLSRGEMSTLQDLTRQRQKLPVSSDEPAAAPGDPPLVTRGGDEGGVVSRLGSQVLQLVFLLLASLAGEYALAS
eukprot:CAMPEP_0117654950 /NCGR_PEP_ID=MMETSP0804-20121206/4021_1 /TAXON_ID=1074897 /ORGANISM="Tetraselmis astigmatica, Strain CCMP880" /LENGTH=96 /DNA_ID=CAMNT_0005461273 /DNA_START=547 /DNA_END=837 /DNA_ORIENTATION=+